MEVERVTTETGLEHQTADSDFVLIERFLDDCRLRGYSPETIRSHGSNLRTLAKFLAGIGLTFRDVDRNVLRRILVYLREVRRVGFKTQKSYFSALSSFYKYLNFEGIHPINPVPSFMEHYLSRYKNSYRSGERRLLSVEEMAMLINSILDPRDKAIVTVLAKTGVRRGELVEMDVDRRRRGAPESSTSTTRPPSSYAAGSGRGRTTPLSPGAGPSSSGNMAAGSGATASTTPSSNTPRASASTTLRAIAWRTTSRPTAAATGSQPTSAETA